MAMSRSFGGTSFTTRSPIRTSPLVTSSGPAIVRSTVDLPEPDGQLRCAEMRRGDSVVMLVRRGDETTASAGAAALYAYVDDVDRALMQAREAGAGVSDAEDRAWGDRAAIITDPDGYRWVLATFKKLAPFT